MLLLGNCEKSYDIYRKNNVALFHPHCIYCFETGAGSISVRANQVWGIKPIIN